MTSGNEIKIEQGDRVYFKPEWSDKGDEKYTFIAIEDAYDGRFKYSALELSHWAIVPVHTAATHTVERVIKGFLPKDKVTR